MVLSKTYHLETFPAKDINIQLYTNVKNSSELKYALQGIDPPPCALIESKMVLDVFQVLVASNIALHHDVIGKKKTKSLYSEILLCLSPRNNVG
eukprot:Ihof_evm2s1068 gene=Ihof_evmTU2s1068